MKNLILKSALLLALLSTILSDSSLAQALPSAKNYWVVETNLKERNFSIVRFYNAANELIYEEKLNGVYLNISRRKHVKRLNLALAQVNENKIAAAFSEKLARKNLIASLYRR
jgi:hypothetical protein